MALLAVNHLSTSFYTRSGPVRAVSDVSFSINESEIIGIVGESGCGKSALCLSLLRLIAQPPGKIETGSALFEGADLLSCSAAKLRSIRGHRISMVFQDPLTSLNPYLRIGDQLAEPLRVHAGLSKQAARAQTALALKEVGIDKGDTLFAYPHALSGGMRQRVMIAMALITRPALLIADEPTTALDVTIQAQILQLIRALGASHGMAVLFVTHNLGIVAQLCSRVLVMYAGRIVESALVRDLFYKTQHPYTYALIGSLPSAHKAGEKLAVIPGQPPDLGHLGAGCAFAPRCAFAQETCRTTDVELAEVEPGHFTSCVRAQRGEIKLKPRESLT